MRFVLSEDDSGCSVKKGVEGKQEQLRGDYSRPGEKWPWCLGLRGTGGGDEENGMDLRKIYKVEKSSRFRYGR